MICVPIVAKTTKEALNDIKKAKDADLIELRIDFIRDINDKNLTKLIKSTRKKIIVTDRKKRIKLVEKAIELKTDFIDLDLKIGEKIIKQLIKNKKRTKVIVSFHNFKKTDKKEVLRKYTQIKRLGADVVKVATFANSINDNKVIFDLIAKAKKEKKKIIGLCIGKKGQISRILSPLFGAELTFGSLSKGKESAPGQLTATDLKTVFRINKLKGKKMRVFGLVGNPVGHSKGIIVHNKNFSKKKKNSIYVNFLVDDIKSFIKNFKEMISGLSVTIPHKRDILGSLDKIDPIARKIGAVNTVVKKNGKLIGYNTDVSGAIDAIKTKTKINGKNILLIGAGGVARAIAFGIVKEKGDLIILNRTISKARKLANELGCSYAGLDKLAFLDNIDIVINGTSIGMFPRINKTPISENVLRKITTKKSVIFDTVYNPKMTKLLKDTKALKLRIVDGYQMFINQGMEQVKLWL